MDKFNEELEQIQVEEEKLKTLELLQAYEGRDEIITSEQAREILKQANLKPAAKFFSKIPGLDAMLDGFREGDVVVISAPTKNGKTTLAQTFTASLSESGVRSLWFSYEMTQNEFLSKFPEPLPFFTLPKTLQVNSLDWLERKIVEAIAKHGVKVVFIDHLHFLIDMSFIGQKGNVSLLIGSIMRKLKQIALKWEVAIVLIAHTTKIQFEKEPDLSDIRDSSFISQEADTVLMIWRRREKETGEFGSRAWVAVAANRRNGKVGKVPLILQNNRFFEEAKE